MMCCRLSPNSASNSSSLAQPSALLTESSKAQWPEEKHLCLLCEIFPDWSLTEHLEEGKVTPVHADAVQIAVLATRSNTLLVGDHLLGDPGEALQPKCQGKKGI